MYSSILQRILVLVLVGVQYLGSGYYHVTIRDQLTASSKVPYLNCTDIQIPDYNRQQEIKKKKSI